jgi:hypothetical protein
MEEEMKRLKELGFKKVRGTEPGFHMYELTPARLDTSSKPQAASDKPQAASRKRQASKYMQFYIDLASKNYKL